MQFFKNFNKIARREGKWLIKETRQMVAATLGRPVRYDYEYERGGVCNIFLMSEPLTDKRLVRITERKTRCDWALFVRKIAQTYKNVEKTTLVMDNLRTYKAVSLYEIFSPEEAKALWDRFEFVYTPKHGSWLNMSEIELNVLTGQCLNRRIDNIPIIRRETDAWQNHRNTLNAKINWQFTTNKVRIKLKRLYPRYER